MFNVQSQYPDDLIMAGLIRKMREFAGIKKPPSMLLLHKRRDDTATLLHVRRLRACSIRLMRLQKKRDSNTDMSYLKFVSKHKAYVILTCFAVIYFI